jgi:hypothetical protein
MGNIWEGVDGRKGVGYVGSRETDSIIYFIHTSHTSKFVKWQYTAKNMELNQLINIWDF